MTTPIQISKATHLDTIKRAFEARELQMFNTEQCTMSDGCYYAGPCGVGVCLTEEEQSQLDQGVGDVNGSSISTLIAHQKVIVPDDEVQWWSTLQVFHDEAVSAHHAKLNNFAGWVMLSYAACVERFRAHLYGEVVS